MQRSASLDTLLMTPQALRIQKASIAIPRRRQWQLFIASLILMDFIMIGVGSARRISSASKLACRFSSRMRSHPSGFIVRW